MSIQWGGGISRTGAYTVTRKDLQRLADLRIEEALILLNARKYAGGYYLAGYSVECGLKACIAKKIRRHTYPDKDLAQQCYTHKLEGLIDIAGLRTDLRNNGPIVKWAVVKDWRELARYELKTRAEALALYEAITDPTDGMLLWIKSHW
jgi:hypothetical protein